MQATRGTSSFYSLAYTHYHCRSFEFRELGSSPLNPEDQGENTEEAGEEVPVDAQKRDDMSVDVIEPTARPKRGVVRKNVVFSEDEEDEDGPSRKKRNGSNGKKAAAKKAPVKKVAPSNDQVIAGGRGRGGNRGRATKRGGGVGRGK